MTHHDGCACPACDPDRAYDEARERADDRLAAVGDVWKDEAPERAEED